MFCEHLTLAQPSHDFVRLGSLSLWLGVNFNIACATFWALDACRIALVPRCGAVLIFAEFLRILRSR